ncbi:hypothetical protein FQN49_005861 [Arthroderma sp. PD_2]|nr:hypothetical protein FQN49_005861 [Arthroderma sp. PD_2]
MHWTKGASLLLLAGAVNAAPSRIVKRQAVPGQDGPVNPGLPTLTPIPTPTPLPTLTPIPTPASFPPVPSPIQDGVASPCARYHEAVAGDTPKKICQNYHIDLHENFLKWNPAVKMDNTGFWVGYHYCVGVPGFPQNPVPVPTSEAPTLAERKTPAPKCSATDLPSPTQPGAVCECEKWHQVASGDVCDDIQKKYKVSADDFNSWNPDVGADCNNLWVGYNVCVGV